MYTQRAQTRKEVEEMENEFVRDCVQEYMGESHLFTGVLSKRMGMRRKGFCTTYIGNAAGSHGCMKEAIENDPLVWRMLVMHTLNNIECEGLDRESVSWLYDLYPLENDSCEDSMLEDIMTHLGEQGMTEWAGIWRWKDSCAGVITPRDWFMALLSSVERGNLSEVKWFFSVKDYDEWRQEEIESGYSLGYHASLNVRKPGGKECLEYVTEQGCCRHDVGVIEELVRIGDTAVLEWAMDQGYT